MTAKASNQTDVIAIKRVETMRIVVPIEGITPVIPHRWSEKAKQEMRDKQQGTGGAKSRAPKNPEKEAEDSTYRCPDGQPGIPATAFKNAMTSAARDFKGSGLTMTSLRVALYLRGVGPDQLVPFVGELSMREDAVRVGMGTADLRYRNQAVEWTADLDIEFAPTHIKNVESILALVDAAGRIGVGDWRPERNGTYGQFRVRANANIAEVA